MEPATIERIEPRKTGHELLDVLTSVCALIISFISIYMAYDNGRDMQKLVHANSWPALQLSTSNTGDGASSVLTFFMRNAGVGPARLHSFEYLVDGQSVADGYLIERIAQICCAETLRQAREKSGNNSVAALGDSHSRPIAKTFLSPNEVASAITWPLTEKNGAIWHAVDEARKQGRVTMRVCYCSVFDECWIAEAGTFPPRQVPNCDAPAQDRRSTRPPA